MADKTPSGENPTEPKVADPAPDTAPVAPVKADEPKGEPVLETPAEVAYDLKVEGKAVNPDLISALTPVFKKAGVKVEDAQEMASTFEKVRIASIPKMLERDLETLKADKELGGLNLSRTQARINDALAAFTTPQERKVLSDLGIANNLTLARMFHRIGKSMQDAPQTDAGPQPAQKATRASKLYGGSDLVNSAGRTRPN